jgi:hypothetical protein
MPTLDVGLESVNLLVEGFLGVSLQVNIQGRKHFQTAGVEDILTVLVVNVLTDRLGEIRSDAGSFVHGRDPDGLVSQRVQDLARDAAILVVRVENAIAGLKGLVGVVEGRVDIRPLENPYEQSAVVEIKLGRRFGEEQSRGGRHAVGPSAEVILVEVHLKNLFLGVCTLELDGRESLFYLARKGLLAVEKEHARELLSNGGGSGLQLPVEQIAHGYDREAPDIHTPVIKEFLIL